MKYQNSKGKFTAKNKQRDQQTRQKIRHLLSTFPSIPPERPPLKTKYGSDKK